MSVQESCEKHNHENRQWSSYEIPSQKHKNHQNYIGFKVYVCLVKTKSIHKYPKNKRVQKEFAWRQVTQEYTCISNSFRQN